jgi:hypothetical protein
MEEVTPEVVGGSLLLIIFVTPILTLLLSALLLWDTGGRWRAQWPPLEPLTLRSQR